jgi:hypothetical protein
MILQYVPQIETVLFSLYALVRKYRGNVHFLLAVQNIDSAEAVEKVTRQCNFFSVFNVVLF